MNADPLPWSAYSILICIFYLWYRLSTVSELGLVVFTALVCILICILFTCGIDGVRAGHGGVYCPGLRAEGGGGEAAQSRPGEPH